METTSEHFKGPEVLQNDDLDTSENLSSGLRAKYASETQVLRHKLGGLKALAGKHDLNQRKLAGILMVDPASVNRWFKDESKVPPYIWRLLDYYFALEIAPDRDVTRHLRTQIDKLEVEVYLLNRQLQTGSQISTKKVGFWAKYSPLFLFVGGIALGWILQVYFRH